MPRLKVLFTQETATPGGAPKVLLNLVTNLDRTRFEPIVLIGRRGPIVEKFAAVAHTYHYPEPLPVPYTGRLQKLVRPVVMTRWLSDKLAAIKPDVIYQTGYASTLWMERLGEFSLPRILHAHGVYTEQINKGQRFINAFTRFADHYVCCAKAVDVLLETCLGIPRSKLSTIYNGLELFEPDNIPNPMDAQLTDLGIAPDDFVVCAIGSMYYIKGMDLFVRMAASLLTRFPERKLKFLWIGGGLSDGSVNASASYVKGVFAFVQAAGLAPYIRFSGHVPDARPLLKRANLFALTSREEAMPLVVLEAMLMGTPIIAFPAGGTAEILTPEVGFITEGFDIEKLAAMAAAVIENPEQTRDMTARARQKIRDHFDARAQILLFEDLIFSVYNHYGKPSIVT